MDSRRFYIDPRAEEIGVRFSVAVLTDLEVRERDPELDRWKRKIQKDLRSVDVDSAPLLSAYHPVLAAAGNSSAIASPELLLRLLQEVGTLPRINTCVAAYNIISVVTRAVVSVHDLRRLEGMVRMVLLQASEPFLPLGTNETEIMQPGEFGARDDHHMLCRLNCKQSRLSSVGLETRDVLVYVQGNPSLEGTLLDSALDEVCAAIIRFNGGTRQTVERVKAPRSD